MVLYDYKISSNCSKFKQKLTDVVKNNPTRLKEYYLREKSKYYIDMIF